MFQEGRNSIYDNLLAQARGSAKYWIPRLCEALKRENPEMTPNDIRDTVKKDCISIWQRDTITYALPDQYKDKTRQQVGRKGRHKQLVQGNVSGITITTTADLPDQNRAKSVSNIQTEQNSDDHNSSLLKLQYQLAEVEEENRKLRKTIVLQRLQKQLHDGTGVLDVKEMPIIKGEPKEYLESVVSRYNKLLTNVIKAGEDLPLKLYVVSRRGYLAPINLFISFKDKYADIRLDRERLD